MTDNKQTIVEFKFPVTDEVLRSAQMTLQRNKFNEPYYNFAFILGDETPKSAVKKTRDYLNRLFGKASEVVVQNIQNEEGSNSERKRVVSTQEVRTYPGEDV